MSLRLRLIGYWSGGHGAVNDGWPHPADLIDPVWGEDERTDVGLYLRYGLVVRAYMGYAPCRLCDKARNGNLELTDGTCVWPEGLSHYVLEHSVRLPQEFVDHIAVQGDIMDGAEIDESWWRATQR